MLKCPIQIKDRYPNTTLCCKIPCPLCLPSRPLRLPSRPLLLPNSTGPARLSEPLLSIPSLSWNKRPSRRWLRRYNWTWALEKCASCDRDTESTCTNRLNLGNASASREGLTDPRRQNHARSLCRPRTIIQRHTQEGRELAGRIDTKHHPAVAMANLHSLRTVEP